MYTKKQIFARVAPFLICCIVISFLLGAFLSSPLPPASASSNAKGTPTISKRINAKYLENHRADYFLNRDQGLIAIAGMKGMCDDPAYIFQPFGTGGTFPTIVREVSGRCRIDLNITNLEERYFSVSTRESMRFVNVYSGGGSIYIEFYDRTGDVSTGMFNLIIF